MILFSCEILEPTYQNTLDLDNNNPPGIVFTPKNTNTPLGSSATINVKVLEVEDIAGVRARIDYDGSKLEIFSVTAGSFFSSIDPPIFIYDNNGASLDIYTFFMGSEKVKSGTGNIATIVFSTKQQGFGNIQITGESELLDQNGQLIPIQSLGSGAINAQ